VANYLAGLEKGAEKFKKIKFMAPLPGVLFAHENKMAIILEQFVP
jgi:hypothetical protein